MRPTRSPSSPNRSPRKRFSTKRCFPRRKRSRLKKRSSRLRPSRRRTTRRRRTARRTTQRRCTSPWLSRPHRPLLRPPRRPSQSPLRLLACRRVAVTKLRLHRCPFLRDASLWGNPSASRWRAWTRIFSTSCSTSPAKPALLAHAWSSSSARSTSTWASFRARSSD